MTQRLPFSKGHGTQNDFILVADPDGDLHLGVDDVRALTDRRAGIGGDGLIRAVASAAIPEGRAVLDEAPGAFWFMDYRNADGSIAEMCGNGVRVFVAFLEHLGLVDLSDGAELAVGTRAGVRRVRREGELLAVEMGRWELAGGQQAVVEGYDAQVRTAGLEGVRVALSIDMGNPHAVVALATDDELDGLDLSAVPVVAPEPPTGTNVEYVVARPEIQAPDGSAVGQVRMRVHERGVGETRSCGTGACAAALAVATWAGTGAPRTWIVDVPGGSVRVRMLPGQRVELAGPAVLVAHGTIDMAALRAGHAARTS